jgi:D-alanyl-D-alanine carboxypeptidase (penicillin-binding protein 5/6)
MAAILAMAFFTACGSGKELPDAYEVYEKGDETAMSMQINQPDFFAEDLCVGGTENVTGEYIPDDIAAALVFLPEEEKITYAENIYDKVYPASTTKILTAYLALKYGNLDDPITVSSTAASVPSESSVCGFKAGDQITLYDALCGLMLMSGNDAANVIAEYVSGSNSDFCVLMNQEARLLGATHSHFVNPHGYPADDHYTTAYDLYLIFQAALKDDTFRQLLTEKEMDVSYKNAAGETVTAKWESTNHYYTGEAEIPSGVEILGGKTGSSNSSGFCLVLYSKDQEGRPVISIIMKSASKEILYQQMSRLLTVYG